MISVLVVDDHENLHQQVNFLLSSDEDIRLVADAYSAQEAILLAKRFSPDVILMDIRMPGQSGIEAARQIKADMPDLKVIFLTNFDLDVYRQEAAAIGVAGYILKENMFHTLLPAVKKAASESLPLEMTNQLPESSLNIHGAV
jgi:DNA-binding NarL/FixJ family response regulator